MLHSQLDPVQELPASPAATDETRAIEAMLGPLTLLPDHIGAPAFFVDTNFSIRWMTQRGSDPFSKALAREMATATSSNVFNLLLRPGIKHAIADWQSFFSFVYNCLHGASTVSHLTVFPDSSPDEAQTAPGTETIKGAADSNSQFFISSRPFGNDEAASGRLYCVTFEKGMLFALNRVFPDEKTPDATAEGFAATNQAPATTSICVLSARLNQAHGLVKTMLPGFFLEVVNRIWEEADSVARPLGGKRIACNGARFCYGFQEDAGRHPVFSAISCAMSLNDRMPVLEEKLGARYGWSNEIRLNIGIGYGADTQSRSEPVSRLSLVIPGGALEQAMLSSRIAGKGQTWITRNAAAVLPADLIDQLVLGADREGTFYKHYFKPMSDFKQIRTEIETDPQMQDFPVARIVKTERRPPRKKIIDEE